MYIITEVVLFFTLIGLCASKSHISTSVRMLPDVDYFRIECLTNFSEKMSVFLSLHLQRNTTGIIAQANFNLTWEGGGYDLTADSSLNRNNADKGQGNYSTHIWVSRITPFGVSLALSFVIDRSRVNCDDRASYQCVSTTVYVNRSLDEEISSKPIFINFQDIFKNAFKKRKINVVNSTREITTNATTQASKKDYKDRPALIAVACSAGFAILLVVGVCVYLVNKKPKQNYADSKTLRKRGTLRQYSVFSNTTEMSRSSEVQTNDVRPQEPASTTEFIEVTDKSAQPLPNADGKRLANQSSHRKSSTV